MSPQHHCQPIILRFPIAQQLPVSQGFIIETSRSNSIKHNTVGRIPLDEWSASRRDLYLTTRSHDKIQASMPPGGFEPATPARERSYTYAFRQRGHRDRRLQNCMAPNAEDSNWKPLLTNRVQMKCAWRNNAALLPANNYGCVITNVQCVYWSNTTTFIGRI